jgi:hypothetical protein
MEAASKAGGGGDRSYKRSWRNLLINKRYQLRFTLFMVGLSAVLMVGLGIWVMRVANDTTEVSRASIFGISCPRPIAFVDDSGDDGADESAPSPSMHIDDGKVNDAPPSAPAAAPAPAPAPAAPTAAGSGSATGSGAPPASDDDNRPHRNVQMGESKIEMIAAPPRKDFGRQVVAYHTCMLRNGNGLRHLETGRLRILYVLILTGILLVFGLAVYGIKMTHKVAGPLFKVGLYHAKMKRGRFDKVYNLRKGDQLVEFYEHFKLAHTGVVKVERSDIERLKATIAAAEAAGVGGDKTVDELREILARKEKSLE